MGEYSCGSCVSLVDGTEPVYSHNCDQHSSLQLPPSIPLVFTARLIALFTFSPLGRAFPLLPHFNPTVWVVAIAMERIMKPSCCGSEIRRHREDCLSLLHII